MNKTLLNIAATYKTVPLTYDGSSEAFVKSICNYFESNSKISGRQLQALIKITERIKEFGPQDLPEAVPVEDKPGFLGLNCKTGEVCWHTWQVYE